MATRFDSVHAESTDLTRAATCTCDKQTACVLGLCAARHLFLPVSCVRFQSPTSTRVRSYKQEWFFRDSLLVRLIPHLPDNEIPLHTLLISVVMSILSSRPRYSSPATLSSKCWLCVSDSSCSQLPMNSLPSEDSPSVCGKGAALSFASICSLSSKSSV